MNKTTPTREQKAFPFEIKEFDDARGVVSGYLSTFDNVDEGGDRVRPGAFKRTLANKYQYKQQHNTSFLFPLLWQHSTDEPIGGYLEAKEDKIGLYVEMQIDLDVQRGKEAYSALKKGYVFQQSMGYDTIQADYVKVDGQTVRDLVEVRLWEGSIVTIPMNFNAVVTDVKSLEVKDVCGNTSGPIGPRDESWDGSAAQKWIWSKALDDDDQVKPAIAKKYFLRLDGDPKLKGSYSYPFWIDDHINVGGVKACAGALSGARGASDNPDSDGMKKKIETLYGRINSKYPDDPELVPPWKSDDGKSQRRPMDKKDFNTIHQAGMAADCLEDWSDLINELTQAMFQIFGMSDTPKSDMQDCLEQFSAVVMQWEEKGEESELGQYLNDQGYCSDTPYVPYTMRTGDTYNFGYMSRREQLAQKAMLASDATTGGFTSDHVDKLKNAATKAMKKVADHADALHSTADAISSLVDGKKAGRMFSAANTQALSDHADDLHEKADNLTKGIGRQMKSVTTVADDLASILQGAEAAYGTDPGDAGDRTEGKATPQKDVRRPHTEHSSQSTMTTPSSSQQDTVPEQDLTTALDALRQLRKPTTIVA